MGKKKKKPAIHTMELDRISKIALLKKVIDMLDDDSQKFSSCEIRVRLLDVLYN